MNWAGPSVGIVAVLCLGLALLGFFGAGSRNRLILAWISMVGFAVLASSSFWRGEELRRSAVSTLFAIPTDPLGAQKVSIPRAGVVPGFWLGLFTREGKPVEADVVSKLSVCEWNVTTCERLALTQWRPFEKEPFFEMESEYPEIELRYTTSAATKAILETIQLKAGCPPGAHKGLAQGVSMARSSMGIFLGGLFLASAGALTQRRKIARAKARAPALSTSGPPAP